MVDGFVLVRDCLTAVLTKQRAFHILGGVGTCTEAEIVLQRGETDIVLLDFELVRNSSQTLLKTWNERFPKVRILLLIGSSMPASIRNAMETGATGCVSKFDAPSDLIAAIYRAPLHNRVLSPSARRLLLSSPDREHPEFTRRENEILRLIAAGVPTRNIAGELGLSPKTVDRHKENLKEKLRLSNSSELFRHAFLLFPKEEN